MKVSAKLAEALTNLRGNSHFAVVLEAMSEHEREETQRCISGSGEVQLRASGAVMALQWWKNAFQSAPSDLDKYQKQAQSQQGKREYA